MGWKSTAHSVVRGRAAVVALSQLQPQLLFRQPHLPPATCLLAVLAAAGAWGLLHKQMPLTPLPGHHSGTGVTCRFVHTPFKVRGTARWAALCKQSAAAVALAAAPAFTCARFPHPG